MSLLSDQNDRFRQQILSDPATWPAAERISGKVVTTPGVARLPDGGLQKTCDLIRGFSGFTEGNDPYGEHDFGSITVAGEMIFWKIDYYDLQYEHGSDDPSDLSKTRRVLTMSLASEW